METSGSPEIPLHRFDEPAARPPSRRACVELEYASTFIPFLKSLERAIGRERVLEALREFAFRGVEEFAERAVRERGRNDLSLFKEIFSPANTELWDLLTIEVLESTEEVFEIEVKECLLAEVFRSAGAAEFGSAALCHDALFTRLVNPRIVFELDGTIMEGKPRCRYRWRQGAG